MKKLISLLVTALLCVSLVTSVWAVEAPENEPLIVNTGGYPLAAASFLAEYFAKDVDGAQLTKDGTVIGLGDYVATGQMLEFLDTDGSVQSSQTVVVLGDVLGTGSLTIAQLVRLSAAVSGAEPLTGPYLAAADVNGSGDLTLSDLVTVAQMLAEVLQDDEPTVQEKTVDLYANPMAPGELTGTWPLYFMGDNTDIPYISQSGMMQLIESLMGLTDFELTENGDGLLVLVREYTDTMLILDSRHDTISFEDFNLFFEEPGAATCIDIVNAGRDSEEGSVHYLTRPAGSFQRLGHSTYINLGGYGIDVVFAQDTIYMPLQTFNDLFLNQAMMNFLYNGNAMVLAAGDSLTGGTAEIYYGTAESSGPRSRELADFTYGEMCMVLDTLYGLKEQHNITTFDTLFEETGLKKRLLSTDPVVADKAVYELTMGYLGDVHTVFRSPSWYAGQDADVTVDNISSARQDVLADQEKFRAARAKYYPDGCPGYEEVGNTAYVTFDHFVFPSDVDYYTTPPSADSEDTVGLIMYAHSQIMRENSPIENVVMDLSGNAGGEADAAVFALAWFLGGKAQINLNHTTTGAQASNVYGVDVNADGVSDENDTVASKKLFCLAAGGSFSCGNLVPVYCKYSDSVTLLGQRTAGGACAVLPVSLADGTFFRLSGPNRLSTMTNGSYYDIDRGAEPDIPITQIDHFYDRELLTDFINGQIYR